MKNSGDNGGNNFFRGPENTGKKLVSDTKAKVYGIYFTSSIIDGVTGKNIDHDNYFTLSEEDYKKVLGSKGSINPEECVYVGIENRFGFIQKLEIPVVDIQLIH